MAHLLSFRTSAFLLLAALLGGCCANNVCDPDDPLADALELRFSRAFSAADLDTVIILRYPKDFTRATRPEMLTLVRTAARARDSILLNNNTPFARVGTTTLGKYRYVVQYLGHPTAGKPVATTALVIDSIGIRGDFKGNGCCTNYANARKIVYAKDSVLDLTGQRKPILKITK